MRVVVVGAYGLLGGYVTARLVADGHEVIGVGRDLAVAARRFPAVRWVRADLRSFGEAQWKAVLEGADAVVNCAGALQDTPRDDLRAVHVQAVARLASACRAVGVRRFVQVSAAGVDAGLGEFRRTKAEADEALQSTDLDWVILRPGLVLAPAAYGGSALLRGLAAFPFVIPALFAGSTVQVVSIDDVVEAVARSLTTAEPRFVCDLVADEHTRLGDLLVALRGWLGLAPAKLVVLPGWVARPACRLADGLAWLGWRSPMRSAALEQLAAGVTGAGAEAKARLGVTPRRLAQALGGWPSGVQERWYARLYFAKPLVLATLAAFWGASGVIGLASRKAAVALLASAGLSQAMATGLVIGGSLVDIGLAILVCFRASARPALGGMMAVTIAYLLGASVWLPALWADPLGPLVKSVPALILALVALALMDER